MKSFLKYVVIKDFMKFKNFQTLNLHESQLILFHQNSQLIELFIYYIKKFALESLYMYLCISKKKFVM